jgi:membrane protein DedA with SNARE-associated domain
MDDWIISLIEKGGYWGIIFLMVLENVFPPIPSELIMGVGGIAVARGKMEFLPLLAAGTAGTTLGNYILFMLADRFGMERTRPFVERWGRWLTVEWREVERGGEFLRRHGQWIVFFLRFMPLLRTVVSIPAGLAHMQHWKFLIYTAAGATIWNTLLITGGQWLGTTFSETEKWLGWATFGLMGLAVIAYLWRVIRWHRKTG